MKQDNHLQILNFLTQDISMVKKGDPNKELRKILFK